MDDICREQHKKDLRLIIINQINEECKKYQNYARMHETILEEHWNLNNPKLANSFQCIEEVMKASAIKIKNLAHSLMP